MRVLILGASGMLGNAVLKVMAEREDWTIYGTLRSSNEILQAAVPTVRFLHGVNAEQPDSLVAAFTNSRPTIVINCIGIVKQLAGAENPLDAIPINSLLPHRLAKLCELSDARFIHVSTDCVFSGRKGMYSETDLPDAEDIYGRTKLIGEVNYPHAITLRTSIIGHELGSTHGLVDWFLSQQENVKGFTSAIFSGLPTCEFSRVIRDFVMPNPQIHGIYHVAAKPISKYDLLQLINFRYRKGLLIESDDRIKIDRSLDGTRFRFATGYTAPEWPKLIEKMYESQ